MRTSGLFSVNKLVFKRGILIIWSVILKKIVNVKLKRQKCLKHLSDKSQTFNISTLVKIFQLFCFGALFCPALIFLLILSWIFSIVVSLQKKPLHTSAYYSNPSCSLLDIYHKEASFYYFCNLKFPHWSFK